MSDKGGMMMRVLYILVLAFLPGVLFTQQLAHFTQFYLNEYIINPAAGGTKNYFDVKSSYRYQWVGVNDAPRTFTLSMDGPMGKKKNMGLGGYVYSDITGPTRRTGFKVSYAYNFKVTSDIKLSFGLAGGLMQFAVDGSEITLAETNDVAFANSLTSAYTPDAAFGAYLYSDDFYASISIPQLIGTELKFTDNHTNTKNKLENHYYINGGYKFRTGAWVLEPFAQIKYIPPVNPQIDIGGRAIYNDLIWLGGTYRSEDAAAVFVGLHLVENFVFSYSYDIITTDINSVSSGTHEIVLGLRFHKPNEKSKF